MSEHEDKYELMAAQAGFAEDETVPTSTRNIESRLHPSSNGISVPTLLSVYRPLQSDEAKKIKNTFRAAVTDSNPDLDFFNADISSQLISPSLAKTIYAIAYGQRNSDKNKSNLFKSRIRDAVSAINELHLTFPIRLGGATFRTYKSSRNRTAYMIGVNIVNDGNLEESNDELLLIEERNQLLNTVAPNDSEDFKSNARFIPILSIANTTNRQDANNVKNIINSTSIPGSVVNLGKATVKAFRNK